MKLSRVFFRFDNLSNTFVAFSRIGDVKIASHVNWRVLSVRVVRMQLESSARQIRALALLSY